MDSHVIYKYIILITKDYLYDVVIIGGGVTGTAVARELSRYEIKICVVGRTIFALPSRLGKEILVTPTVHGNLLLGPTAIDTKDKEGCNTTQAGLEEVIRKAGLNVKNLPL